MCSVLSAYSLMFPLGLNVQSAELVQIRLFDLWKTWFIDEIAMGLTLFVLPWVDYFQRVLSPLNYVFKRFRSN